MNKHFIAILAILTGLLSSAAHAAPGEYWEVTSKMEMPGMPFAMPATTTKVCIAKGGENDPRKTSGDKDCQMSDIKTVGKKTTFKVRCDRDGEVMTGTGEQTASANASESKIHFSGKSRGRDTDMTMTASSKRIGGSCDSEEAVKKMQAQVKEQEKQRKGQIDKLCDTSTYNTSAWVNNSQLFIGQAPVCPGKKEALCQVMRNDVPHDLEAYEQLVRQDQGYQQAHQGSASPVKTCKLNLDSMKKSLCKAAARKGPQSFLDANCPAEAKAYREWMRKREECEGRGYTGGDKLKQCLGGDMIEEDTGGSAANVEAKKTKANKSKTHESQNDSENSDNESSTSSNMLEGAKKMKGLFGF